ncbi:MAG: SIS domain-containing protein [Tenacibaculum sp.]
MKNLSDIISTAKDTILLQSNAVANLINLLNNSFAEAVNFILNTEGRVIVTGIGKSANIGAKIAATLNSTGTPAVFMHAADAIHGDLGNVQKNDAVICISKSGNTPEIKVLVPFIKNLKNKVIAITSNPDSFLGKNADFLLNSYVAKEACPNNLAPTTSTTAQLVLGDALAICLLKLRGFSSSDFAKYHPGGTLGKKLYLRVSDFIVNNQLPQVTATCSVAKVIVEISEKRLGITAVIDKLNKVIGVITDGDIRRMLSKTTQINGLKATDIMSKTPVLIHEDALAIDALKVLKNNSITQVLAVDNKGQYTGVVHLHDLIKEGIL